MSRKPLGTGMLSRHQTWRTATPMQDEGHFTGLSHSISHGRICVIFLLSSDSRMAASSRDLPSRFSTINLKCAHQSCESGKFCRHFSTACWFLSLYSAKMIYSTKGAALMRSEITGPPPKFKTLKFFLGASLDQNSWRATYWNSLSLGSL